MVIIGADVSGNTTGQGQARYIGLVMGTEESINSMYKKIGLSEIHMVTMTKDQRRKILQTLEFNNKLIGLCLNVEKQKTISSIINDPKFNSRHISKNELYKHFDYLLFRSIRHIIEPFAVSNRCEINDIIMQCDPDMDKTGMYWNMKISKKGKAYECADALSWANEHGCKIKHCKEIDLVNPLRVQMRHDSLK